MLFYRFRLTSNIIFGFGSVITDPCRTISYPDNSAIFRNFRAMPVVEIISNNTIQNDVFVLFESENNSSRTNYQELKNQQYSLLYLSSAQTHVHTHNIVNTHNIFLFVNLTKHIQYKNKTTKNLNMVVFAQRRKKN